MSPVLGLAGTSMPAHLVVLPFSGRTGTVLFSFVVCSVIGIVGFAFRVLCTDALFSASVVCCKFWEAPEVWLSGMSVPE